MGTLLSRMPGVTPFLDDASIMGFSSTEITGQHIKIPLPPQFLVILRWRYMRQAQMYSRRFFIYTYSLFILYSKFNKDNYLPLYLGIWIIWMWPLSTCLFIFWLSKTHKQVSNSREKEEHRDLNTHYPLRFKSVIVEVMDRVSYNQGYIKEKNNGYL